MIDFDLRIQHHFSDGLYAKKMEIPKDHYVVSHKHKYDHLSILSSGRVLVKVGDDTTEYEAPACINILAGIHHSIVALEDAYWYCIHATSEADAAMIDPSLIEEQLCQ